MPVAKRLRGDCVKTTYFVGSALLAVVVDGVEEQSGLVDGESPKKRENQPYAITWSSTFLFAVICFFQIWKVYPITERRQRRSFDIDEDDGGVVLQCECDFRVIVWLKLTLFRPRMAFWKE